MSQHILCSNLGSQLHLQTEILAMLSPMEPYLLHWQKQKICNLALVAAQIKKNSFTDWYQYYSGIYYQLKCGEIHLKRHLHDLYSLKFSNINPEGVQWQGEDMLSNTSHTRSSRKKIESACSHKVLSGRVEPVELWWVDHLLSTHF